MYNDEYHPQVKKDLKKLASHIRKEIQNKHIPAIISDPAIGEPLTGDLNGIQSYHFTIAKQQFRISYTIYNNTIFILMIGKRENFYITLKRRI